jgi:malonate decarboxylase alpha subunit
VTASGRTTPRTKAADRDWNQRRTAKLERLEAVRSFTSGRVLDAGRIREALEALLRPGDRVALEGDNQKQADFLAETLAGCDPEVVHDLHLLISSISLREHLDVFERGAARRLDLAYAGPQSVRMAQLLADGKVEVGAIHTYVELYARMFVDLTPDVVLLCAEQADREGNLARTKVAAALRPRPSPLRTLGRRGHIPTTGPSCQPKLE